jgi:hypothetical protein
MNSPEAQAFRRNVQIIASQQYVGRQSYEYATRRNSVYTTYGNRVSSAMNVFELNQLEAQLAAEQARLQNSMYQMMALQMYQQGIKDENDQKASDMLREAGSRGVPKVHYGNW